MPEDMLNGFRDQGFRVLIEILPTLPAESVDVVLLTPQPVIAR